jgi:hypothetical protein
MNHLGFTGGKEVVAEDLLGQVESLVGREAINPGQANALSTKLDQAIARAEEWKYKVAVNLSMAFINQVNDLVATGVLTGDEAAPSLVRAETLIELWSNP